MSLSFILEQIVLKESILSIKSRLPSKAEEILVPQINLSDNYNEDNNQLYIYIELSLHSKDNNIILFCNFQGIFKIEGNATSNELNNFANINAPAIIFPFVREHIASLALKAGLGEILIPPVNFIKLAEDREKQKMANKENTESEEN